MSDSNDRRLVPASIARRTGRYLAWGLFLSVGLLVVSGCLAGVVWLWRWMLGG